MSTRSITHIHQMPELDEKERIICTFYRHHDGYPEGHGKDLSEWLENKTVTNGLRIGVSQKNNFNRMGTMAVALMGWVQEKCGCEVVPTGDNCYGEEYTYDVHWNTESKTFLVLVDGVPLDEALAQQSD